MEISRQTQDNSLHTSQLVSGLSCFGALDLGLTRRLATLLSPVVILAVVIFISPGGVR